MPNLLVPSNKDRCIPFTIGSGDSSRGSRLGGRAPKGIAPSKVGAKTKYFITFQIDATPVRELSIFLNCDFQNILDHYGDIQSNSGLVYAVVHSESVRSSSDELASDLSEHPIEYEAETDDWVEGWEEGELMPANISKLGGRATVLPSYRYKRLNDEIAQLEQRGFSQVVQIGFPNTRGESCVFGDWPFAGGFFHLFGKPPYDHESWHFLWEI